MIFNVVKLQDLPRNILNIHRVQPSWIYLPSPPLSVLYLFSWSSVPVCASLCPCFYYMSKRSCPFLYSNLLYKRCNYFLDTQYLSLIDLVEIMSFCTSAYMDSLSFFKVMLLFSIDNMKEWLDALDPWN